MSENGKAAVTFGTPWMLLLTIFFILMKLNVFGWETKIMDFSWIWVFSPLWIPLALVAGIFGVVFIGALIIMGIGAIIASLCK